MKEAVGQTISLQVILVFLVFLNAFLAFSVNYTKAFRVKNKAINELEQNEGLNSTTKENINRYINKVGYDMDDPEYNTNNCYHGVCVVPHCIGTVGNSNGSEDCSRVTGNVKGYRIYYSVTTYISVNVPIMNKILNQEWNIFKVQGDTSVIYVDGNVPNRTSWS